MLIDQNLKPAYEETISAQQWRKTVLWNEPVDNILKAYLPVLRHIYDNLGGTALLPGQKFHMTVSEFENFTLTGDLVNDVFSQRDAAYCFNMAMMTQINDIENERHIQGQFIEFLEAFCRVAEISSFPPNDDEEYMTLDERKSQPLHTKLENVLPLVMKNCARK